MPHPSPPAGRVMAGIVGAFDTLPYSHRKEWVRWIEDAKRPDTRSKRLLATVPALHSGQRQG